MSDGETAERLYREAIEGLGHTRLRPELARDGLSNPEIGARLFLSPRTVEWHPRKVFTKLGISSRKELAAALPQSRSELVAA